MLSYRHRLLLLLLLMAQGGQTAEEAGSIDELRSRAQQGDQGAQEELADAYKKGRGVKKDTQEAEKWAALAAEQGSASAAYIAGVQYYFGSATTPANHEKALEWFTRAAELGHAQAARELAVMHFGGLGCPKDDDKALAYGRQANMPEDAMLQNLLGFICLSAKDGRPRDAAGAYRHTLAAAQLGHADAQERLARLYEQGIGAEENPAESLHWLRQAAANGHPAAMNKLAILHMEGTALPKDEQAAAQLFRRAAEAGHADAQFNMARLCNEGSAGPKDTAATEHWLRRAAEQGHTRAQMALITLLQQSSPDKQEEALQWLYRLGMHLYSTGHTEDGLNLLRQAAAEGSAEAIARLHELSAP